MNKVTLTLVAAMLIAMTSCEKDEANLPKPNPKEKLLECRTCDGTWDKADPKP